MTTSRSRWRQEPPLPSTRPAPADVALVGPPGRERPQQRGPLQKAPDGPSAAILTVFGLLVVLCELSGFQCPCRTYTFHVRAEGE